ncbi:MAG TPA: translation elongation factor Ts [Candidatus Binatia bacterium]|nr:translation elongation factor Ts [Candidatus Binatia bacterium]
MAEVTAALVKQLRDRTGAGMMDCKRALEDAGGDLERAEQRLRERGAAKAFSKAGRATSEGVIEAYLHAVGGMPPKVGVLVEVDCESDFVAKTDEFKRLARELALQVAGANPEYVRPEDVPVPVVEREREIARAQAAGKPEAVVEKMVAGKLAAFYSDVCLLEQPWIRDEKRKKKVKELVQEAVAKLGENITVARFARFAVGETSSDGAGSESR